MLKFTFVIARYGADVLGGAEKHARDVAEHLAAAGHDVQVLTTCATSYQTWRNELPEGASKLGGVRVERFRSTLGRLQVLDEISKAAAAALPDVEALTRAWAVAQGPTCPRLLEALRQQQADRDLIVFFSLLSQLTFLGLAETAHRSALVPLVHEERPIYLELARRTLRTPRALLLNTEEEAQRVERVAGPGLPPIGIVAVGAEEPLPQPTGYRPPTTRPYLLILGRHAKTRPMLPVWEHLVTDRTLPSLELSEGAVPWSDIALVTVGELSPLYRKSPNVVPLGFVSDAERWALLRGAIALINPSVYESLSLVLLEAWACELPVVVNDHCDVTVGQCRRSGGGVAIDFGHPARGARQLADGLSSLGRRRNMGNQGQAYQRQRYAWNRVTRAYEHVATAVRDGTDVAHSLHEFAWRPLEHAEKA